MTPTISASEIEAGSASRRTRSRSIGSGAASKRKSQQNAAAAASGNNSFASTAASGGSYSEDLLSHASVSSSNYTQNTNLSNKRSNSRLTGSRTEKSAKLPTFDDLKNFANHCQLSCKKTILLGDDSKKQISLILLMLLISLHIVLIYASEPPSAAQRFSVSGYLRNDLSPRKFANQFRQILCKNYSCCEMLLYIAFTALLNIGQNFTTLNFKQIHMGISSCMILFLLTVNSTKLFSIDKIFYNPINIASLTIHHYIIDLIIRITLSYFDTSKSKQIIRSNSGTRYPNTRNIRGDKMKQKNSSNYSLLQNLSPRFILGFIMKYFSKTYFNVFALESSHNFEIRSSLYSMLIGLILFHGYLSNSMPRSGNTMPYFLTNTISLMTTTHVLMHFLRGYKYSEYLDSDSSQDGDALYNLKLWKYSAKVVTHFILVPIFSSYPIRFALLDPAINSSLGCSARQLLHIILSFLGLFLLYNTNIPEMMPLNSLQRSTRRNAARRVSLASFLLQTLSSSLMISELILTISSILSHPNINLLEGLAMDSTFFRNLIDSLVLF